MRAAFSFFLLTTLLAAETYAQSSRFTSYSIHFHEKLRNIVYGYGLGVGARINHFEGVVNLYKTDGGDRAASLESKIYPEKSNQRIVPYVSLWAGYHKSQSIGQSGNIPIPSTNGALGAKYGFKWRIIKGFYFDLAYGAEYGYQKFKLNGVERKLVGLNTYFHYAIGYEFIPKKHYSQPTPITSPFQNGFRHSFTIKSSWYRSTARQFTNVPDVPDLGISYGYFITPWLQGHLGFTIGNLPDYYNPENEDVGFKGLDGGIRVYGLQRKGWAYFVEGSYHYHQSEKRYMYLNHLHFGQYFSLKILENMDVLGGVGLNIFESDDVFSLELGVTVSPFGR